MYREYARTKIHLPVYVCAGMYGVCTYIKNSFIPENIYIHKRKLDRVGLRPYPEPRTREKTCTTNTTTTSGPELLQRMEAEASTNRGRRHYTSYGPELLKGKGGLSPVPSRSRRNYYYFWSRADAGDTTKLSMLIHHNRKI